MSVIVPAGLALSALSFLLLLWLLRDWWRRVRGRAPWAPAMGPAAVRWGWPALLTAAFVAGLWGIPLLERSEATGEAAAGELPVAEVAVSELRLPFYVQESSIVRGFDGSRLSGGRRRIVLQVPWPFLVVAGLYGLAALHGRRPAGGGESFEGDAEG